ncbi:MAG: hypothetical protein Q8M94_05260 [Ignavibacteria bacterium]|nr:hypothetical protein [Ignavibacteria bacterium]
MGMFDNINYTMKCPKCGHLVGNFQSKDKGCSLTELELWQVDNFYSFCHNCETWIEFNLKKESRKKFTIDDYEMEIKESELTEKEGITDDKKGKAAKYFRLTPKVDKVLTALKEEIKELKDA